MRVKIFFVLILCALQQVYGSKSKKKGGNRIKKFLKKILIALAVNYGANEVVRNNAGKPQVADSNSFVCKYNVPDQNAEVMMNFVKCVKDQDFEKYMFDNSENCPKINELYKQVEIDENCALNTPKIIPNGALASFRREQLSEATHLEMLKEYLLSYPGKYGALFESKEFVSDFLNRRNVPSPNENFDFFRFKNMLELTKLVYPDNEQWAILMALNRMQARDGYIDVNADNAKKVLELIKLAYPDKKIASAARMALKDFKDVNVDKAKKVFELTKLAYPNDESFAVKMALERYEEINVDQVKHVLELTKILNPKYSMLEALKPRYKNVDVDRVNLKYQDLKNSKSWYRNSEEEIMKIALKMTYPEVIKEEF